MRRLEHARQRRVNCLFTLIIVKALTFFHWRMNSLSPCWHTSAVADWNLSSTRMTLVEILTQQLVALPLTVRVKHAGHFALKDTAFNAVNVTSSAEDGWRQSSPDSQLSDRRTASLVVGGRMWWNDGMYDGMYDLVYFTLFNLNQIKIINTWLHKCSLSMHKFCSSNVLFLRVRRVHPYLVVRI